MIKFNSGEDSATSIYTEATRLSPISQPKKEQVLKDYGMQVGWAKGKSDTAISKGAADAVLKKWKADQAKAKAEAKKAADAAAAKPATPAAPTTTPAPTPAKVVQPKTTAISRADAAALSRQYGLDPAKLYGYGTDMKGNYWVNATSQAYIWSTRANFEGWLKRVLRQPNVAIYR